MIPLSRQIVIQNSPPQGKFDNMHQDVQIPRKMTDSEQNQVSRVPSGIFLNSPGRRRREQALRKCGEGCRKQVVWARKNCENRLSPGPAQGGTNGTK
ncbi:hypothetical protein KI387_044648, partial [Taxus chinensis]